MTVLDYTGHMEPTWKWVEQFLEQGVDQAEKLDQNSDCTVFVTLF